MKNCFNSICKKGLAKKNERDAIKNNVELGEKDEEAEVHNASKEGSKNSLPRSKDKLKPIQSKNALKLRDLEKGDQERQNEKPRTSNFPCCFYIPLDIAMEGFALIDIIYYLSFALLWVIFVSLEPFAGKDANLILENLKNNDTSIPQYHLNIEKQHFEEQKEADYLSQLIFNSPSRNIDDEPLDINDFRETTTTIAPLENHVGDTMNEARVYSRIALQFKAFGQEIDDGCGRDYFVNYLYAHQLDKTRDLFEEVARKAITASLLYALIGFVLLSSICCFRGYIASKLIIIFLWYMQLIPSYIMLRAAVVSQSHRFCILQYGLGKTTRGQQIMWWVLVWPLLSYKLYEAFIWANYIQRYFKNKEGKLLDESYFSTGRQEARQQKEFSLTSRGPNFTKDEFKYHRRPVGRNKLFLHTQSTLSIQSLRNPNNGPNETKGSF